MKIIILFLFPFSVNAACFNQYPPTCASLDFFLDGNNHPNDCNKLNTCLYDFIIKYNYLCSRQINPSCSINTSLLSNKCFSDISRSINNLYHANGDMCNNINRLFDVNNASILEIKYKCNINTSDTNHIIYDIIFYGLVSIISMCIVPFTIYNICKCMINWCKTKITTTPQLRIKIPREIIEN